MPKAIRDQINVMMQDGLTYREIISALGEPGQGLTEDNLSNWKSGGYTDWLRANERREMMLALQETFIDRALRKGGADLSQAAIQLAVTRAFQLLDTLPDEAMTKKMDSNNFTRLLNALARLAGDELKFQRHTIEIADRETRLKQAQLPKPEPGLSDEVRAEIEQHHFSPPPA